MPAATPRRPRTARRTSGFSLVELLVVITLIGLLAAMAGPRLDVGVYQVNAAAHEVGTTLMVAQRTAVARGHNVVVAVDAAQRSLRIHHDADNDGAFGAGEVVRIVPLPEGATFGRGGAPVGPLGAGAVSFKRQQEGLPAVTFLRSGATNEEGGFYLTSLRSANSAQYPHHTRALRIERATGRISWFRAPTWDPEF